MMRIDAWTHFIPKPFADKMAEIAGNFADIGKRMREIPCIHDLDERRRVVDMFSDYAQILSHGMPPIENVVQGQQTEELCKLINDGFTEICSKHKDQFPGWVAQVSLGHPEGAIREAQRAIKNGALGVQTYTNINGKPLDRPEYAEFWAAMAKLGKPVWIHPTRGANFSDYQAEQKSLYEIWWTFGWSYETAAAMARLVFSKTIDNNPGLKLVMHHFGGIVPMLEGRIGPGWDQIGARTSDADYQALKRSLKKRPLDYFKQDFIVDTAVFTSEAGTTLGLSFYPNEHVVFASDCPFDPEKGTMYIRETLRILDNADLPKDKLENIYYRNLETLTGTKLVK
jgi:aminocarboxymuconate-semialdehyde decarboxylase